MTIISLASGKEIASLPKGCSVALGFFDGVHIGHREILSAAVGDSRSTGRASAVWMIGADGSYKSKKRLLTDEKEKLALIGSLGIDYAVISSFNDIRDLSGEQFVQSILADALVASTVLCGFNFRFGKGAAWGTDDLSALCAKAGMGHISIPAVTCNGENVSSSAIRQLIAAGDVSRAAELLGRPYFFRLPVLCGKMLGRRLGFPTANQIPPAYLACPPRGVYATMVETVSANGETGYHPGSTNIGVCPTVTSEILSDSGLTDTAAGAAGAERAVAETYIEGFSGDLYGKVLKVSFLRRIRGEMRFPSVEELSRQIGRDSEAAKLIFEEYQNSKGVSENERES